MLSLRRSFLYNHLVLTWLFCQKDGLIQLFDSNPADSHIQVIKHQ